MGPDMIGRAGMLRVARCAHKEPRRTTPTVNWTDYPQPSISEGVPLSFVVDPPGPHRVDLPQRLGPGAHGVPGRTCCRRGRAPDYAGPVAVTGTSRSGRSRERP